MLPSACQSVWIQIRPDIMLGLIWVQTVCKSLAEDTYHADNELRKYIYQISHIKYFLQS